jgi:transcription elongation factor Elf1
MSEDVAEAVEADTELESIWRLGGERAVWQRVLDGGPSRKEWTCPECAGEGHVRCSLLMAGGRVTVCGHEVAVKEAYSTKSCSLCRGRKVLSQSEAAASLESLRARRNNDVIDSALAVRSSWAPSVAGSWTIKHRP